jgi:hypothetical protein
VVKDADAAVLLNNPEKYSNTLSIPIPTHERWHGIVNIASVRVSAFLPLVAPTVD